VAALLSVALVSVALLSVVGCSGPTLLTSSGRPAGAVDSSVVPLAPASPNRYILGRITAEESSTWTVLGIRGNTYTVSLTPLTMYGSMFHSKSRDQFKPGDNVRIAGDIWGTRITATAVDFSKRAASNSPTG
jgi:hypothetical protein